MRAPFVTLAPSLPAWAGVPVAHGARVGELGLAGELALGLADSVVGGPDAAGGWCVALVRRR